MKQPYSSASKRRFAYLMVAPTLVLFVLVTLYPLISALELSFHSWNMLSPSLGRPFIGLRNYKNILLNPKFWESLKITLSFAAGTVVLQFVLGFLIALVLNKEFFGKSVARTVILLP